MPMFEYKCERCSYHFDKIVAGYDAPVRCPLCEGKVKKLMSTFSVGGRTAKQTRCRLVWDLKCAPTADGSAVRGRAFINDRGSTKCFAPGKAAVSGGLGRLFRRREVNHGG